MSDKALTDPHQIKDAIVDQYRNNSLRMGLNVPTSDLERIATSDLQIVDRLAAQQKPSAPAAKQAPDPNRVNRAAAMAAEKGAKFTKGLAPDEGSDGLRDLIMDARPRTVSARFDALMYRAFRIMRPNESATKTGIEAIIDKSDTPTLAKKMLAEFMNYKLCHLSPAKNPYYGKSLKDRNRIFLRRVEDLCDQSTAFYGPWWVK